MRKYPPNCILYPVFEDCTFAPVKNIGRGCRIEAHTVATVTDYNAAVSAAVKARSQLLQAKYERRCLFSTYDKYQTTRTPRGGCKSSHSWRGSFSCGLCRPVCRTPRCAPETAPAASWASARYPSRHFDRFGRHEAEVAADAVVVAADNFRKPADRMVYLRRIAAFAVRAPRGQ